MPEIRRFKFTQVPPSVNAQKRSHGGRLKTSKVYEDWQKLAKLELLSQRGFEDGDFLWRSSILFPCNVSGMDIDNAPKALHDALVKAGKVPDDRYLVDSRIRWARGDSVIVAIQREELATWAQIKTMSKSLMKKLAR